MVGLLSGNEIQDLFSNVLGDLYEDGQVKIYKTGTTRNLNTGTFTRELVKTINVKLQREKLQEIQKGASNHSNNAQRGSYEYTVSDARFLILQAGITDEITSECVLVYRNKTYSIFDPIEQDPARVYWDVMAREEKSNVV